MQNFGSLSQNQGRGWAKNGSSDDVGRVSINQIEQLIGVNLDWLRNLPDNENKLDLKGKVYDNPYLNAPLSANNGSLIKSSDGYVGTFNNISTLHDGILVENTNKDTKISNGIKKTGVSKLSTTSISPRNISSFQISSSKINSTKPSVAQISPNQVSSSQVRPIKFGTSQVSTRQINSSQIGFVMILSVWKKSGSLGFPGSCSILLNIAILLSCSIGSTMGLGIIFLLK